MCFVRSAHCAHIAHTNIHTYVCLSHFRCDGGLRAYCVVENVPFHPNPSCVLCCVVFRPNIFTQKRSLQSFLNYVKIIRCMLLPPKTNTNKHKQTYIPTPVDTTTTTTRKQPCANRVFMSRVPDDEHFTNEKEIQCCSPEQQKHNKYLTIIFRLGKRGKFDVASTHGLWPLQ